MNKLTEKKWYPWLLVVLFSLMGLSFPAAVTQFSMVAAELAEAMQVPKQTVLLADTMRAICLVVGMFASDFVYRRLGLRKTICLGVFFQAASQFLIPLTVSARILPLFFVFKAMQGLNAVAFPLYLAAITQWIDSRPSGLATALFNGSFTAGAGVGAFVVGRIVPLFGWKASFFFVGAICLVFATPVLLVVREKPAFTAARRKAAEAAASASGEKNRRKAGGSNGYGPVLVQVITWMLVITLVANTWITQAVTVDLSVYAEELGYSYGQTGTLMLYISIITVISSILGGAVSDFFASRSRNRVRSRALVLMLGYVLSAVTAIILPSVAGISIGLLSAVSCAMMFGASWSAGVFWALPAEIYPSHELVSATAFCSGASNIPNPIAPAVVGVMLGTRGHWAAGWLTCCAVSVLSVFAALYIAFRKNRRPKV